MDSGPSTPSFPQGSGVGGSSNTSRFRLSELLAPSPHERPRTASLKGKQAQQESFRSSRIYDLHASTSIHTSESSPPEANPSPKRSRTSFLATAQDAFMLKKFGRKKKPLVNPTSLLPDVIEITATETKRNSIIVATQEEEEERERLRDAAAQSIGLDPDLMSKSPTSPLDNFDYDTNDDHDEFDHDRDAETNNPTPGSHPPSREGSHISSSVWVNDLSSSQGHRGRTGPINAAAKSSNTCAPALTPTIPVYPTTVAGLANFTQLSRVLPKYYPGNQLLKFALMRQWKNRFVVMSSPVQPNQTLSASHSSRPTPTTAPTVSYLHLFKSNNPSEKELERLEINEDSVVFVNENNEEISGRRNVLRIGGVDCGAMKKDLNIEEGGRTMWLLQVSDQQELQRWISAIKNSVLGQRSVRAGLGLPTSNYGGAEPRGDMDVMLSMRAQNLISSRSRGMSLNSGSGNNAGGISNSGTNSQPLSQSKTQTSLSPASPKLPMSTLKGFFTGPNRPRTPSLVGSNGSIKADESSSLQSSLTSIPLSTHHHHPPPTTSAGTHILNRLRGNSDARPLSPLGYTPSITSISTATNKTVGGNPAYSVLGGVDFPLSSAELERKILLDQTDTTTNGASGSNWAITQRKQNLISQQLTGFNGLTHSVSSPLQPPPWRKQSTGPSSATQSLPQSQIDLSEPDSATYSYLHTNMSAIESFGVHNTHPPSRYSMSGTRPSLDLTSHGNSQGSGMTAGGSVKGSLGGVGGGEKKTRPPSWTSTSSITESIAGGPKRWSRQGVLPKRLTPPSGALPSIPVSGTEEEVNTTPRVASPHPYSFDGERTPSRSSSYSTQNSHAGSLSNSNLNSPQNGFSTTSFLKRQSGSSFQSATSTSNVSSQMHTRTSTGSGTGNSGVGSYISRSALSIQNRLSLAPPQRPVPNTALPPTPTEQDSQNSSPKSLNATPPSPLSPSSKSSFRESLTQRAMRMSLAGMPQKTPPTTNLPLRPDDPSFMEGHRRSNSSGGLSIGGTSRPTTLYTIPGSPSPAEGDPDALPPALIEKERQQTTLNLNLKQRLRMLSAPASTTTPTNPLPPTLPSNPSASTQLLAADQMILKPQTEGEDSYGSVHTRLLIGEPITTMQNDPSFLLMNSPMISSPTPPTRLMDQPLSPSSSSFPSSNPSSPLPTQTQFPSPSMLPPPQYRTHSRRSPQLTPLPVPPRSPFRQLPKPPSPAPSQNSRRSQPLPPSPPPTHQLAPEITSLSPPPWTAARRSSVIPAMLSKEVSTEAEPKDERPPPTFMDSPPLFAPPMTPPVPLTPRMSSADSITNLSI
ncbi:hypothetical protein BDM02DRAFT_3185884 [Thelephora ganbajun]|uniref:Uncharacterized protein n=1 Tax=Thelephora ganbajun TaxID=370292 RepID=A0ACB6ZK30_THEGA|nr:hypothetical protein BDM02DRAFT_3185884 [Thelephora ganbajun]